MGTVTFESQKVHLDKIEADDKNIAHYHRIIATAQCVVHWT